MTMVKLRNILYLGARLLGDLGAVRSNRVGKRIVRRILGRLIGRSLRKSVR